jgi:hypothetical protein
MFNWYSAPSFAALLLFVLLAAYVLTRSPRTPATVAAVGAELTVAAYLFGQGMQANATTVAEWHAWARNLQWGAAVSPVLWYWLTALLLGEQPFPPTQRYLRRFGYPFGVLLAAAGLATCLAMYLGDSLYVWTSPQAIPPLDATYYHFRVRPGPFYPAFGCLLLAATLGAAANLWLGSRLPAEGERRRRFQWLLVSAVLFLFGVILLALTLKLSLDYRVLWLGQFALAVAMAVMASNVAAYRLLINVEVVRGDLAYFVTVLGLATLAFAVVFLATGPGYSFRLLELYWFVLLLLIAGQAVAAPGRQLLDRLFFQPAVRRLRTNLASTALSAPLTTDLDSLLMETQAEISEVSAEHMFRLTEEALRRLNRPGALAQCGLIERLPHSLGAARARAAAAAPPGMTPLAQAKLVRELLTAAVEGLKPADRSAPAALQYLILREEYILDLPNKQIIARHGISEGTFHRQRREAIAVLARELRQQEAILAAGEEKAGVGDP